MVQYLLLFNINSVHSLVHCEWIRVNDTPVTDLQYTIDNLTRTTEYEFRVAARNKTEISDFSLMSQKILTVEKPDKPGHPEVVEVIGTSVHLQWTAPCSDGGAAVTEYKVTYRTSEEIEEISDSVAATAESLISYTIRNVLQANTKYRFAVAAVNRIGRGPWSEQSEDINTFAGMLMFVCTLNLNVCLLLATGMDWLLDRTVESCSIGVAFGQSSFTNLADLAQNCFLWRMMSMQS